MYLSIMCFSLIRIYDKGGKGIDQKQGKGAEIYGAGGGGKKNEYFFMAPTLNVFQISDSVLPVRYFCIATSMVFGKTRD